jgi:hypothetical protein
MTLLLLVALGQVGADILVNDDTSGGCSQFNPAIAHDDSGNYYCIWTDYRAGDYDSDIYLQKFDSTGNRIGRNLNLIDDQPSRDIWRYMSNRCDVSIRNGTIAVVEQDRRRGNFDIYFQPFDLQLRPLAPLLLLNDDWGSAHQDWPRVAAGGLYYVAVWGDWREGTAIYAQILDSLFLPIAPNFRVSEITGLGQYQPTVAASRHGFVVTWMQQDNDSFYTYARSFTPTGTPVGASFRAFNCSAVNPFCVMDSAGFFWVGAEAPAPQTSDVLVSFFAFQGSRIWGPVVVSDPSPMPVWRWPTGDIVPERRQLLTAWIDRRSTETVYAQWLDSLGHRLGPNFLVCSTALGRTTPDIAVKTVSNYAYVWEDSRSGDQDIWWYNYFTGQARVNDDTASTNQDFSAVGMDSSGNAFVVWFDYRIALWNADIFAQRFDRQGQRLGANFRVNDDGDWHHHHFPWVAVARDGRTVTIWRDNRRGEYDIYCQLFDASGQRVGPNLALTEPASTNGWPKAAIHDPTGIFIAAWQPGCYRLYRWGGEPMGPLHRLPGSPDLAYPVFNPDCTFWLAWTEGGWVYVAKFDTLNQQLTPTTRLNDTSCANCVFAARDPNGTVWVSWQAAVSGVPEVFGRRVADNGIPQGNLFKINDDNVPCEHWFPVWATDGERMYVVFDDFRVEGDPNVMGQTFALNGTRIGPNYLVVNDPHPMVHQWTWGSIAACPDRIAYTWIDNRNLRGWDVYFRLDQPSALRDDAHSPILPGEPATVIRRGQPVRIRLPASASPACIRIFNQAGRQCLEARPAPGPRTWSTLSTRLPAGVYYTRIDAGAQPSTAKLVILD